MAPISWSRHTLVLFLLLPLLTASVLAQSDRVDFQFAAGLHDRGLHGRAVKAFDSYLENWPKGEMLAKAHFYKAVSLQELNRKKEAAESFSRCARVRGHDLRDEARLREGLLRHQLEEPARAIKLLQPLVNREGLEPPLRAAACYYLGEALVATEKDEEGRKAFEVLTRSFPEDAHFPYAHNALAFIHVRAGRHKDALEGFMAAAEHENAPRDLRVEAILMVGECLLKLEDTTSALQILKSVAKESEQDVRLRASLAILRCHCMDTNLEGIKSTIRTIDRLSPGNSSAHRILIAKASDLHQQKKDKLALDVLAFIKKPSDDQAKDHAYWKGILLSATGDFEAAESELRAALKKDPTPRRRYALAEALSQRGEHKEAAMMFAQVRKTAKEEQVICEATFAEAYCRHHLKDYKDATTLLNGLLKRQHEGDMQRDALVALGENQLALEQYKNAEATYTRIMQLKEVPPTLKTRARLKRAWARYQSRALDGAIKDLRIVTTSDASVDLAREAAYLLGKALEENGQAAEAAKVFKALAGKSGAEQPEALFAAATTSLQAGDPQTAASSFRRLIEETDDAEIKPLARLGFGDALRAAKRHKEARKAYTAFLKNHPRHKMRSQALLGRALCAQAIGQHKPAIADAKEATQAFQKPERKLEATYICAISAHNLKAHDDVLAFTEVFMTPAAKGTPQLHSARFVRSLSLIARKRHQDAATLLLPLSKLEGFADRDAAQYQLGFCYRAMKDEDKALATWRDLSQRNPGSSYGADTLLRLAEADYDKAKYEDASKTLSFVIDLENAKALRDRARYKLGWCFSRMGKNPKAREQFLLVSQLQDSPLAAESAYLAGELALEDKDHATAIEAFDRMLELDPRHELELDCRARIVLAHAGAKHHKQVVPLAAEVLPRLKDHALEAHVNSALGDALFARKSFERARVAFQRVTQIKSTDLAARAQHKMGLCLEAEEHWDDALDEHLKVTILYTHQPWVNESTLHSARILIRQEKTEEAQRLLQGLIKNHGESQQAKTAQRILDQLQKAKKSGGQP